MKIQFLRLFLLISLTFIHFNAFGSIEIFNVNESKKTNSEISNFDVPKAEQLGSQWWNFLEVKNKKNYQKYSKDFKDYLRATFKKLPRKPKVIVYPYLEDIVYGINFLKKIVFVKDKKQIKPSIFHKEKYNLKDFYALIKSYHHSFSKNEDLQIDLNNLRTALLHGRKNYGDLMAEYLAIKDKGPRKIILAFKLISQKVAILISEARLRDRKEEQFTISTDVMELKKELEKAKGKISIATSDKTWIKEELRKNQLQTKLFQENQRLEKGYSRTDDSYNFSPKAIYAKAQKSLFLIQKLNLELLKSISLLKDDMSDKEIEGAKKSFSKWSETSGELLGQIKIWNKVANREFNKKRSREKSTLYKNYMKIEDLKNTFNIIQLLEKELGTGQIIYRTTFNIFNRYLGGFFADVGIIWGYATNLVSKFYQSLNSSLFTIKGTPVTIMGIFRVIIIILLSFLLSRAIQLGLKQFAEASPELEHHSVYILGRLSHYLILTLGIVIGLSSIGIDFSSLAIVAGALSVGIGFGLQSIFNNFLSGLILLFERPLKVGDFVELESGIKGEVREINVRATRITTRDNIDILVPNSEFINGRVTNLTLHDHLRRVHVPFGVAYGTDKEKVKKVVLDAIKSINFTINSPKFRPDVWLTEFADSSLNFELVVWINQKLVAKAPPHIVYLWEIETALKNNDIEIPFPQRDLHVKTFLGKETDQNINL